jgi:hypothetical protein
MRPTVIAKGKAAKASKNANYRASLFAYAMRFTVIGGTSGIVRRSIREWGYAKVNGATVKDDQYQVKPGDTISVLSDNVVWHHYEVTADQIEKCW